MSQSSSLNSQKILDQLKQVQLADGNQDVVSAGLISGITIHGAHIGFLLQGNASDEALRQQCEQVVQMMDGVEQVTAVLTAHQEAPAQAQRKAAVWNHEPIAGVNQVIAIASGKGGVGKSSIAVLLALAMTRQGKSVGLLDADIYGPSIPTMLGLEGRAELNGNLLIPGERYGIKVMSMGFIIGEQATVMRAPRVTKALQQMLRQTDWANTQVPPLAGGFRGETSNNNNASPPSPPACGGDLDVLLVDMPPGTGDVHLSMAQQAPLAGAIIVTLASKVAIADAKKSIEMFEKVNVPILGVIENMSYLPDGTTPFGSGGGEQLAKETGYPLLAKLPLEAEIGELLNAGKNPFEEIGESELLESIISYAKLLPG